MRTRSHRSQELIRKEINLTVAKVEIVDFHYTTQEAKHLQILDVDNISGKNQTAFCDCKLLKSNLTFFLDVI